MKKLFAIAAIAIMALGVKAQEVQYKIIAPLNGVEDGQTAYLVNYDTGERIDSVIVADHAAVFTGMVDEPFWARILVNDARHGTFILEGGTTAINPEKRVGVGNMLNDEYNEIMQDQKEYYEQLKEANPDDQELVYETYKKHFGEVVSANMDSPIGYYLFLDYGMMIEPDQMLAFVDKYPELKDYRRVQKLMSDVKRKKETSPGKMFTDFEITYEGITKKLSDYVGKGKYVLVDFWASWCGPCMREIETLKDINAQHAGDKFQVLGVAVWDEPQNTLSAIKRKEIPWDCIINAQTIPTDLYGISGIPCIILFGPDGTILSRDLQGEELKTAVDKLVIK